MPKNVSRFCTVALPRSKSGMRDLMTRFDKSALLIGTSPLAGESNAHGVVRKFRRRENNPRGSDGRIAREASQALAMAIMASVP